jgi:hypothetical protein
MKKINVLVLLFVAVFTVQPVLAGNNTFGASWSLALPTGNTKDFTSPLSARGFNLEYQNFFRTDTAFGVNIGYNVFTEEQDQTFVGENFAVTGLRWHYINTVPIYASLHKFFGNNRDGRFFVGLNAGTAWLEQRMTLGLYEFKDSNWHLGLAPEVGYNFPWDSFLGYASLRFNHLFKAGDIENQGWFELRLGFGLD